MSLKDFAKNFVDFDEAPAKSTGTLPVVSVNVPMPQVVQPRPVFGTVDESLKASMMEELNKATADRLLEFYGSIDSFSALGMDEVMSIRAAFLAYGKTGGTQANLEVALDARTKSLESVEADIETELNSVKVSIDQDHKHAADLDGQMQNLLAERDEVLARAAKNERLLSDQRGVMSSTLAAVKAEVSMQCSTILNAILTNTAPATKGKK